MGAKRWINRKVWGIALIIAVVTQILFDPLSGIINLRENVEARLGLDIARNRWEAQKIANYSFDILAFSQMCIPSARVEVRNGEVIRVNLIDSFGGSGKISESSLPTSQWANPYWTDVFYCNYANFTVPQFFDMVGKDIRLVSRISFHARYGFISEVRFGSPSRRGVLGRKISDCCTFFRIENFQVLEE